MPDFYANSDTSYTMVCSCIDAREPALLSWPKNASPEDLAELHEAINLQLRGASRRAIQRRNGELEYASWIAR